MGRGCTRESKRIVGKSIHGFTRCELLMAMIIILTTAWKLLVSVVGLAGWCVVHLTV